jgi:flagellar M-ring protein FliF
MDKVLEIIKRYGAMKVALIGSFSLALFIILLTLYFQITGTAKVLLYGNLEPKVAGEIITKLEGQGIAYELRGDGTQILVNSDVAPKLRMLFAQEGLPASGVIGYEIFDKGDSLSTTAFTQDINYIRALEGELTKSIISLDSVSGARVHLVIPKREPFQREQKTPSASVILKTRGTDSLSRQQIGAIRQLVSASVPGLDSSKVAVIDQNGRLLAKSEDGDDTQNINNSVNEHRVLLEEKLSHTVESLVERTVGTGKVRARVSVDLDLDRITESSELYDPESQVIRSTQVISDVNQELQSETTPLTVRNAVPGAQATPGQDSGVKNKSNKNQEIVNYEISKTVRQYIKESGDIKRLSIAVMVDGVRNTEDGTNTYTPRTPEELENIKTLVKSALGFQQDRGDEIQVINLPFVSDAIQEGEGVDWTMGFTKHDIFKLIELSVFLGIGLLIIFVILKPFVSLLIANKPPQVLQKEAEKDSNNIVEAQNENGEPNEETIRQKPQDVIKLKNVSGLVQSDTVDTIYSLLEDYPQQAARVVNTWLNER